MSYTSSALDSQLLCACGVSYAIGSTNPLTTEPYFTGAGYTTANPPTVIKGLIPETAACLVSQVSSNIVIAFRGTVFSSMTDWATNLMAEPVQAPEFPGGVHAGFYVSVMEIMPQIMTEVESLLAAAPGTPIVITGHSKGGGMASLCAWYLNANLTSPPTITVTTFASPMPGNGDFASAYRAEKFHQRNYINYLDAVPWLPPSSGNASTIQQWAQSQNPQTTLYVIVADLMNSFIQWDYTQVASQMDYITSSGKISDWPGNMGTDWAALVSAVESGDYSEILAAHSHTCGSGYMNAICPGVCP